MPSWSFPQKIGLCPKTWTGIVDEWLHNHLPCPKHDYMEDGDQLFSLSDEARIREGHELQLEGMQMM